MPSGTGKTVSLLSLIVSYQQVSLSSPPSDYLLISAEVLPNQTKAHLLFTNRPRDRESSCGTEKTNGLPDLKGGDRGGEGEGKTILSIRFDESKKPLYTSRGMLHTLPCACGL